MAGLAAVVGPGEVGGLGAPVVVLMVAAALAAGDFAYTKQRISKLEGVILLAVFAGFAVLSL